MLRGLISILMLVALAAVAHAEKRVALVIGNSAYRDAPLTNPKNDALLMARTLEDVGFEVTALTDVDYRSMKLALVRFGRKLRSSDTVGLVYYAGHGVQVRGENYLIPVDADIQDETEVGVFAINVNEFLGTMERSSSRINIVVLDACRNNPFARSFRSQTRGLARVDAPKGTYIAYATAPGRVALDGETENSPYTTALVKAIATPGLTLEETFKAARRDVLAATEDRQIPWETSSITGRFYFKAPEARPAVDEEAIAWTLVKASNNAAMVKSYLETYPAGRFAPKARALMETLEQSAAAKAERERQLREKREQERLAREKVDAERKTREAELQAALVAERQRSEKLKLAALSPPAQSDADPVEELKTVEEMVVLAERYETGKDIAANPARAARWYREAAAKGDARAKYRLGLLYYHGRGVGRNWTEAAIQILDAVRADHKPAVEAMTTVATLNDPQFLRAVQQRLKALGYYRSTIDGKWGPGSRSAIASLASGTLPVESARQAVPRASASGNTRPRRTSSGEAGKEATKSATSPNCDKTVAGFPGAKWTRPGAC